MTSQILLDATPFGVRGAVLKDEVPTQILHRFKGDRKPQSGDLFWAKTGPRDSRLGAQVCRLGEAGEGLLPVKDRAYPEGKMLRVAVRREGSGSKRPLLTDRPMLKLPAASLGFDEGAEARPGPLGRMDVPEGLLAVSAEPATSPGKITGLPEIISLLTSLASSSTEEILCSTGALAGLLQSFVPGHMPVESHDAVPSILNEIEEDSLARVTALEEGGGSLVIDQMEAMTAIDVDLGASQGQSKKGADGALLRRAIAALGPALSLRGIGGQVVIDLPRGAVRAPKMIRDQLTAALKPYGLMSIPAVTKEGLVVMIFGQERVPVLERLTEEVAEKGDARPARRYHAAALAQRAYSAVRSVMSNDTAGHYRLALPAKVARHWEAMQASQALTEMFSARLSVDADEMVTFRIESQPR